MIFLDRKDAGRRLASALARYADRRPVVLALPRGGVPVAAEVARALNAPLDLVMVRKLGAPGDPELAMGAVADRGAPVVVWNPAVLKALHIPDAAAAQVYAREIGELARRRRLYLGERPPALVSGRTAIVIDDGLATGATMRAALRAVRAEKPKTLVLAVPVAAQDSLERIGAEADDVVCLEIPERFLSVGFYYREFPSVSDEEVLFALGQPPGAPEPLSPMAGVAGRA